MKQNNEWLKDYEEFLNSNVKPPHELTQKVTIEIHKLMNPNSVSIFFKILGIHIVVGFLSLSICHQFGLNPFNTEYSLSDWFMTVGGHSACMMFCGVFFISTSLLVSGIVLTTEEISKLRKHQHLQILTLGTISLGFLFLFGAEITFGIAALWFLGAFIGGLASTQTLYWLGKLNSNSEIK